MAVVAHSATPDKTDKVELEFWEINGDSGENSRMKVQNVAVDSTATTEASAFAVRSADAGWLALDQTRLRSVSFRGAFYADDARCTKRRTK